jgi:hypothetical protein
VYIPISKDTANSLTVGTYRLTFQAPDLLISLLPDITIPQSFTVIGKEIRLIEVVKSSNRISFTITLLQNPIPIASILTGIVGIASLFSDESISLVSVEKLVTFEDIKWYVYIGGAVALLMYIYWRKK